MDLKQFVGRNVVVQLKGEQRWLAWSAPQAHTRAVFPDPVLVPIDAEPGGPMMHGSLGFIQGKVGEEGELIVDAPGGGKFAIFVAADTIASITQLLELSADKGATASGLIVPGN